MIKTKRQREMILRAVTREAKMKRKLQVIYRRAIDDAQEKIDALMARQDVENLQSIAYQIRFQEELKGRLEGVLKRLDTDNYAYLKQYVLESHGEGFIGALYSIQGQGVPLVVPRLAEREVLAALDLSPAIFTATYDRLGINPARMEPIIRAEIARGAAAGRSWGEVAGTVYRNVGDRLGMNQRAVATICRTVGHSAQSAGCLQALEEASELGANIIKVWDATLDGHTRPWHLEADGQQRRIDEPFIVMGEEMDAPGIGGSAENVMNCRCALLEKASWLVDTMDYKMLNNVDNMDDNRRKMLADKYNIPVEELGKYQGKVIPIKAKSYEEFKREYDRINF